MRRVCSYCRKDQGEVAPLDDDAITHTICDECLDHFTKQWSGLDLGEYLDRFDAPVLVVEGNEGEGRVVAANQRAADLLGKSNRELVGLLGGEAMECEYARLPEGCGRTEHCATCTVRNIVQHTHETGEEVCKQPAHIEHGNGHRTNLLISTTLLHGVVQVRIDEAKR